MYKFLVLLVTVAWVVSGQETTEPPIPCGFVGHDPQDTIWVQPTLDIDQPPGTQFWEAKMYNINRTTVTTNPHNKYMDAFRQGQYDYFFATNENTHLFIQEQETTTMLRQVNCYCQSGAMYRYRFQIPVKNADPPTEPPAEPPTTEEEPPETEQTEPPPEPEQPIDPPGSGEQPIDPPGSGEQPIDPPGSGEQPPEEDPPTSGETPPEEDPPTSGETPPEEDPPASEEIIGN